MSAGDGNKGADLISDHEELLHVGPIEAVRMALLFRSGSLKNAWAQLDVNGNGQLSLNEFDDGLKRLRIPWRLLCPGMTHIKQLFKMLDEDGNLLLDLEEFLGYADVDIERDWHRMSRYDIIKHYLTQIKFQSLYMPRTALWRQKKDAGQHDIEDMMQKTWDAEFMENLHDEMRKVLRQGRRKIFSKKILNFRAPTRSTWEPVRWQKTFCRTCRTRFGMSQIIFCRGIPDLRAL